jgi:hypothetical protein
MFILYPDFFPPDPDSGSRGQKSTGSRTRSTAKNSRKIIIRKLRKGKTLKGSNITVGETCEGSKNISNIIRNYLGQVKLFRFCGLF